MHRGDVIGLNISSLFRRKTPPIFFEVLLALVDLGGRGDMLDSPHADLELKPFRGVLKVLFTWTQCSGGAKFRSAPSG